MAKKNGKEIKCCIYCGRDTTSSYQICFFCTGGSAGKFTGEEQKGRPALSMNRFQAPLGMAPGDEEEQLPIKYELRREIGNEEDFW